MTAGQKAVQTKGPEGLKVAGQNAAKTKRQEALIPVHLKPREGRIIEGPRGFVEVYCMADGTISVYDENGEKVYGKA